jgi:hypothetical protein
MVCFAVLRKPDKLPLGIAPHVIVLKDFYDNYFSRCFEYQIETALLT